MNDSDYSVEEWVDLETSAKRPIVVKARSGQVRSGQVRSGPEDFGVGNLGEGRMKIEKTFRKSAPGMRWNYRSSSPTGLLPKNKLRLRKVY